MCRCRAPASGTSPTFSPTAMTSEAGASDQTSMLARLASLYYSCPASGRAVVLTEKNLTHSSRSRAVKTPSRLSTRPRCVSCLAPLLALVVSACSAPRESPPQAPPNNASAAAPAQPASMPAAQGPRLFVSNEIDGTVSVIDTAVRQLIYTVPVGKRPRGIRVSPDGRTVYVALSGSPIGGPECRRIEAASAGSSS